MSVLIKRNLKLFFRDRAAVLFSLMAVFIIIALYAVFLSDSMLGDSMKEIKGAAVLLNTWLIAGLLAVSSVTTAMGAFGVMIDDKTQKIDKDFYSAPIKSSSITAGYLGSAYLIGVIMTLITVAVSQVYLVLGGGEWMAPLTLLKVLALVFFSTMTNTAIICFIVSFFKSMSAFSTASILIGTLIGFVTGIYLPIGDLPSAVQMFIKVFPVSHSASLFRQVLMENALQTSFAGVPAQYLEGFEERMGVTFSFGGTVISPWVSVIILAATAVVFFALAILNMSKKRS